MSSNTRGKYVSPQKIELIKFKQKLSPIKKKLFTSTDEFQNVNNYENDNSNAGMNNSNQFNISSMTLMKPPVRKSSVSPLRKSETQQHQLYVNQENGKNSNNSPSKSFHGNRSPQKSKSIFNSNTVNSMSNTPTGNASKITNANNSPFSGISSSTAARRMESILLQNNSSRSGSSFDIMRMENKDNTSKDLFDFTMSVDRKKTLRRTRSTTSTEYGTSNDNNGRINRLKIFHVPHVDNFDIVSKLEREKSEESTNDFKRRCLVKDDLDISLGAQPLSKTIPGIFENENSSIQPIENIAVKKNEKAIANVNSITTLTGSPISRFSHTHHHSDKYDEQIKGEKRTNSGSSFLAKLKSSTKNGANIDGFRKEPQLKSCLKSRLCKKGENTSSSSSNIDDENSRSQVKTVSFNCEIEELQADNTVIKTKKLLDSFENETEENLTDNDLEEEQSEESIDDAIYHGVYDKRWKELNDRQLEILTNLRLINEKIQSCEKIQKLIILENLQISNLLAVEQQKYTKMKKKKKKDMSQRI